MSSSPIHDRLTLCAHHCYRNQLPDVARELILKNVLRDGVPRVERVERFCTTQCDYIASLGWSKALEHRTIAWNVAVSCSLLIDVREEQKGYYHVKITIKDGWSETNLATHGRPLRTLVEWLRAVDNLIVRERPDPGRLLTLVSRIKDH
jgi:hypothetical protein